MQSNQSSQNNDLAKSNRGTPFDILPILDSRDSFAISLSERDLNRKWYRLSKSLNESQLDDFEGSGCIIARSFSREWYKIIMALSANNKLMTTKRFLQDIIVSDDSGNQFPIYSFDLLVVVEPDQTTFFREDALDLALDLEQIAINYGEKMFEESLLTEDTVPGHAQSVWPERTRILWLRNATDNYFVQYGIDKAYVAFQYNQDHQASEDLIWYLQAAYNRYPQWRVAVVGGMLEDEIIDMANFIRKMRFETTVLTRYCLSKKGD